eukprot:362571-Chlamydomonas_euryale.AAC.4
MTAFNAPASYKLFTRISSSSGDLPAVLGCAAAATAAAAAARAAAFLLLPDPFFTMASLVALAPRTAAGTDRQIAVALS